MKQDTFLKYAIPAGFVLLTSILYRKVRNLTTAQGLILDIIKVNIVGLDKLYIHLKISNPSEGTVSFDSINTELYFNNINIGRLYYNKTIFIAHHSDQTYIFPVIMYTAGQIQVLTNMLKTKASQGIFKIDGTININGIQVPIKKTFKSW